MHTTLPSGSLAEMFPEVPSTRPFRSISFAVASTASWASGTLLIVFSPGTSGLS